MTKKDLFKARLGGKKIDFGFIPKWRRKKFVQFCKDNELIVPITDSFADYVYKANATFCYQLTQTSGSLFGELAELFADLTNRRKSWRTEIHTINISPGTQPKSRLSPNVDFDWIVCTRDIMF